jgi:hypothetical protein
MGRQTYRQFSQVAFTVFSLAVLLPWASGCNSTCVSGTLNPASGSTVDVKASSPPPSCKLSTANGIVHMEIGATPASTFAPGSTGMQVAHLFVSIAGIDVHSSPWAVDDTPGWHPLAGQMQAHPIQIDLLANLGVDATSEPFPDAVLPSGAYRQIRLRLSTPPPEESALVANLCGTGAVHCAVAPDGRVWPVAFPPSRRNVQIVLEGTPGRELYVPPDSTVGLVIELDRDRSFLWPSGGSMLFAPVFRVRVHQQFNLSEH